LQNRSDREPVGATNSRAFAVLRLLFVGLLCIVGLVLMSIGPHRGAGSVARIIVGVVAFTTGALVLALRWVRGAGAGRTRSSMKAWQHARGLRRAPVDLRVAREIPFLQRGDRRGVAASYHGSFAGRVGTAFEFWISERMPGDPDGENWTSDTYSIVRVPCAAPWVRTMWIVPRASFGTARAARDVTAAPIGVGSGVSRVIFEESWETEASVFTDTRMSERLVRSALDPATRSTLRNLRTWLPRLEVTSGWVNAIAAGGFEGPERIEAMAAICDVVARRLERVAVQAGPSEAVPS